MTLEATNTALLIKWLFIYFNEDGVWHEMLWNTYFGSKVVS
jgi:hypothetical protein